MVTNDSHPPQPAPDRGGGHSRRPVSADKMLALAERVEALTGPSFQIECEISEALGVPIPGPAYTASIDAAVRLVPEGWFWRVGHSTLYDGWAHINRRHPDSCEHGDEHSAQSATPALALCAAALRAIASREGER